MFPALCSAPHASHVHMCHIAPIQHADPYPERTCTDPGNKANQGQSAIVIYQIGAETRRMPWFRYFQINFVNENFWHSSKIHCILIWNMYLSVLSQHYFSIDLDNGLMPWRWQAIIWINDGLYVPLDRDEYHVCNMISEFARLQLSGFGCHSHSNCVQPAY